MKKALLIISSVLVLAVSANAQETFYPGWQLGVKGGAIYSAGEAPFNQLVSPIFGVNAGYQFNPWFTLRGEVEAYQSKGAIVTTTVNPYKFNYAQLDLDGVFDICNMFNYKSTRLFSPYVFAGIGGNVRFNNGEAVNAFKQAGFSTEYLWDKSTPSFTGRVGAGVDIRLSDAVKIALEFVDNMYSDKFNSKKNYDTKGFDFDYNLGAMIGLKFTFGQAGKKAAAEAAAAAAAAKAEADRIAAEKAAAEAAAAKAAAERAAAEKAAAEKAAAEKAAAEKAAAERAAARHIEENVLFVIGKTNIRKSEDEKIQNIVNIMNQYPEAVVSVTGYADKNTGYPELNMRLSQKRAENVAKAIEKAGISADRISVNYVGDTQKVSDTPSQNRVAVCITK